LSIVIGAAFILMMANFLGGPGTIGAAEKCVKATKAPMMFKMDVPKGCYVAGWLGYGQTASLVFTEPGTYKYDVEFKVGGKTSGTIVVK
jgi:hypothetical protein